jgi:hypothetical protein
MSFAKERATLTTKKAMIIANHRKKSPQTQKKTALITTKKNCSSDNFSDNAQNRKGKPWSHQKKG